ncbi:hypothetical protein EYC87_00965 [Halieaceae bacterium IMCC8485]|uniref:General secretion pathway protein K n=1 Tax=Candidatus Seongchinamella marina TaxID=2518990 RepID=A0ABT3SR78_9GAMM|nr:hypothetical protein [Candidatus Seongchinamella marina]MCX2972155.1 hypothetical protein [Candidatus Seongchinamella marina]
MIRQQRGVALALVIWFVAGMSLLVAGIVASAQVDTKVTQIHLAKAKAVAAGDGAIQLAMIQRRSGYASAGQGPQVSETIHQLGEVEVVVRLYPASGFIDVSSAPKEVLTVLFSVAGGLDPGEAQYVAENVVKWRSGKGQTNRKRRRTGSENKFHSLEDMLRVEGVSRSLLDGIRDYAKAGSWASSSTDWGASPAAMMSVLKSLDPAKAEQAGKRRAASARGDRGGRSEQGGENSGVFRADAYVQYGGRTWLRRRWLSAKRGQYGLPWRAVRTEAPRVVQG